MRKHLLSVVVAALSASPSLAVLTLDSAHTSIIHGASGTFTHQLSFSQTMIEGRRATLTDVVLTFNEPVVACDGLWDTEISVSPSFNFAGVSVTANQVTVHLLELPDGGTVTITVDNSENGVCSAVDSTPLSPQSSSGVSFRLLVGDVDGDGDVDGQDHQTIQTQQSTVDQTTCKYDITADGIINSLDLALWRMHAGNFIEQVFSYKKHPADTGPEFPICVWNGYAAAATDSETRSNSEVTLEGITVLGIAFFGDVKWGDGQYDGNELSVIGGTISGTPTITGKVLRIPLSGVPNQACVQVIVNTGSSGVLSTNDSLISGIRTINAHYLYGDFGNVVDTGASDGITDLNDVTVLAKALASIGGTTTALNADLDINCNGIVDCKDGALLAKRASGVWTYLNKARGTCP